MEPTSVEMDLASDTPRRAVRRLELDRSSGRRVGHAAQLRRRGERAARPAEGSHRSESLLRAWPRGVGSTIAPHGPRPVGIPLRAMQRRFGAVRLAERYDLSRASHGDSVVHRVTHGRDVRAPRLPGPEDARLALEGCLECVWGIGPATGRLLRSMGVTSVRELARFARHEAEAADVVAEWDAGDLAATCHRLTRRLGERGHLLSALACAMVAPEDIVFLDLETMGLWNNVVFLAGVGRVREGSFVVDQYLAPGFGEEPAVIALTLHELAKARVVVTYNGRSADIAWLASRAFYYGLDPVPSLIHVDLMYGTRRRFQRHEPWLDSVQLPIVSEALLGLPRPAHDVESWQVPLVYQAYAEDPARREGLLVPVLEHNRADLEVLVSLLERLCAEARVAW